MNPIFEIFAGLVLVGAIIWVFVKQRRASGQKKIKDTPQTRLERAVWAWALVVHSSHETPGPGSMVRVTLELEVHLPGTPAYTTDTVWLVEQESLEYVEAGKEVSIKVDPLGVHHIFPNGPWAKPVEK